MNEYIFLVPIAVALFIGAIAPGPSFLVVAQTAMKQSRIHGLATSIGMGVGAIVFSLLASFGLFIVLENIPWLYVILKLIGGIYLCYLALKMWMNSAKEISNINNVNKEGSIYQSFTLGLFIQLSNPKTAIVFGGVFMAFLPPEAPSYSHLLLSIIAFCINTLWYSIVAIALTTKIAKNIYIKLKKYIDRITSGIMGFMGIKLVLDN